MSQVEHILSNARQTEPQVSGGFPSNDAALDVPPEVAVKIYRSMLRARMLEVALVDALKSGADVYVGHPVSGQEAVAAGVCAALTSVDRLYCGHRAKHWAIAKGCNLQKLTAEFCGKATGYSRGWGGEMHLADRSVGFMGSNHVVGSTLPVAVGSALAARLDDARTLTVAAFGDGASVQGTFHEALNLAAIWNLPVLFVCENNQYAESTPVTYHSRPAEIYKKAGPYGIEATRVDGQDAIAVWRATQKAADAIRGHGGPRFIEAVTYRYMGHYYGDRTSRYRPAEEEHRWAARDPLDVFASIAVDFGLSEERRDAIVAEVEAEVFSAVEFALHEPTPDVQFSANETMLSRGAHT